MTDPVTRTEMLDTLEAMLEAQLRAVRTLRGGKRRKAVAGGVGTRKSNMSLIEDILRAANEPLHVNEIIARARRDHGRALRRESIVSALTKKVLDRQSFERTGPNVFGLLAEAEGEP